MKMAKGAATAFILLAGLSAAAAPSANDPMDARYLLSAQTSYPEGIARHPRQDAVYVAGSGDGRIARIDLATGSARPIGSGIAAHLGGAVPAILGLKIDDRGRLWMAGGRTGKVFVSATDSGALLQTIEPVGAGGLINDVALTGDRAYFTDTLRPILWATGTGAELAPNLEPWLSFEGTPLQYGTGPNLNGIVATRDGRALLVGQMNKGLLFKIDVGTRAVTPIDLGGETVTGVDGLILEGRTLFVIRQPEAEIVTIRLSRDLSSGKVLKRTRAAGLLWPATGVIVGRELLVVNTQFNKRASADPERPFSIQRIPLSSLRAP
jgi:sugar lactone lactonase YvrE